MRILFITSTRIGDAVLSTGLLAHFVDKYPDARITVVCGPVVAPLFEAMPEIHEVIALKKQRYSGHWFMLWRRTVTRFWDVVVDLRGSAINWVLPARQRFVSGREKGSTHKVIHLSNALNLKAVANPRLRLRSAFDEAASALLRDKAPILAVCPTANWVGKTWPAKNFAKLICRLTKEGSPFSEATVVLVGGPGEERMALEVCEALDPAKTINLVGEVDLPTAYACLSKADFFVGNDSGLMHLAAAAGVPTVGLFGPSQDTLYAPWGDDCLVVRAESFEAIVNNPEFDHRNSRTYMASLSVDTVEQAIMTHLSKIKESERGHARRL